uniref:Zinc finger, CCHC-type n=1 Tax=Tanacetum cinerariifolium TaxID=118510 RepID=A0A6L2JTC7_TANCI|nr:zinc finger, CCHC-type [Tanacetum cinerariifolium]
MMSFLFTIVTSRFPSINNQLRNSSNPRQQATMHDGWVTVQQLHRRLNSYATGEGHMARQFLKPKRKRDASWFREKVLLVKAQGNGKVLTEQELELLADPGNSKGSITQTIITNNAAYQADDLDSYDSDCDDITTSKVALMANLSRYDSDVLSEETESLTTTFNVLKNESKDKETKNIDKEIALEKKVKELDNIVYKIEQELSAEQAFWFQMSNPSTDSFDASLVKLDVPSELPKNRVTPNAITKEVQIVFNQIKIAVQQHSVDKRCLEIANNQVLNENDRLLEQIISQDIMNIAMNSSLNMNAFVNVNSSTAMNDFVNYVEICNKCLELKAELICTKLSILEALKGLISKIPREITLSLFTTFDYVGVGTKFEVSGFDKARDSSILGIALDFRRGVTAYSFSLEEEDKYERHDFRRWQMKMHFLLTTLKVVYVLTTPMSELLEDATVEVIRIRTKWENDDYICRGHILNGMSDSLFDVYTNVELTNELWDSLESKYMVDAITRWIDFGATTHVCKDRCWFKTFEPVEDGSVLYMGDEHFAHVHGKGSVALEFSSGKTVTLFNVLYVPKLHKNLVSGPVLNKCGYKAVVRLPYLKRKTLGEKGIDCIFVGYAEHSKAYSFYVIEPNDSISINSIIESRDEIFDENHLSSIPRPKDKIPNMQESQINDHSDEVPSEIPEPQKEEDPRTYNEAMQSWDAAFWKEAIEDEIGSIMENNTWVLSDLPLGCKPLGFRQKEEIDYFDTYAPVARITTISIFNGDLDEEVYMKQPEGFVMPGEADIILGIMIKRKNKGIVITQSHYIKKILKKFNHEDCSPVSTPMDPVEKLKPNTGKPVDQLEYLRAISCLMYAMKSTRSDIAYAVGRLSRFTSNPIRHHWKAIIRVFKYLRGTKDYGLSYVGYPSVLEGYSDASWINHVEDSSSTSGWVFLLGGGAISWASKKQICITGSTMESEFVALAAAGARSKGTTYVNMRDKNNRETHIYYLKDTIEQAAIVRKIVKQGKLLNPLDSVSYTACKYVSLIQELLGYVRDTCPDTHKPSEKLVAVTPMNKIKTVRISQPSSSNIKNKVEAQPRKVNKPNRVVEPICEANVKHTMLNANSQLICVTCKQCMFDANHDLCFLDVVNEMNMRAKSKSKSAKKNKLHNIWKPTGKIFTEVGLKKKPTRRTFTLVGNLCPLTRITSNKVVPHKETTPHSIETQKPELKMYSRRPKQVKTVDSGCSKHMTGDRSQLTNFVPKFLGHNLFSVGQFCNSDLEVAFRKHTCFVRNLKNLGKLQAKADIGIFIGYAPKKKAYRIYNRRTQKIIKTIHVDFDELTTMASEQSSLELALHEMTPVTPSSELSPNPTSSAPFVPPTRKE